MVFSSEEYRFTRNNEPSLRWQSLGVGHKEAKISDDENNRTAQITLKILQNCTIYQFHDTSAGGPLKTPSNLEDTAFLKTNAQNLAAILYDLQQNHSKIYQEIVQHIKIVLPIFDDFELHPLRGKIRLNWRSSKQKEKTFSAHLTSDGTLRFIALVTLLCMPLDRVSDIVLLDEPELGLHPYAIRLVANLIKRLGKKKQVIVATQSPLLLDNFEAENLIVIGMKEGTSQLKRLNTKEYKNLQEKWGDLWQQNIFGGNPK